MPSPKTRRYSIEIKDPDNKPVLFTAVDWTDEERLIAVTQIMRLAGLPDDNWSPGDKPGTGQLNRRCRSCASSPRSNPASRAFGESALSKAGAGRLRRTTGTNMNVRIDRRLPSTDAMPVSDNGQCLEGRRTKRSLLCRRSAKPLPCRRM